MNKESQIYRVFAEKIPPYDIKANGLFHDLKNNLNINNLAGVRYLNCYDICGISKEDLEKAMHTVFAEPALDIITIDQFRISKNDIVFAMEYLPGQFDQRADSAAQCLQIINQKDLPLIHSMRVIILEGKLTTDEIKKIKDYCINPVDSREASLEKPQTLFMELPVPDDIRIMKGFIEYSREEITSLHDELGLAMGIEDLAFIQEYFRNEEKRDPSITEIRVIDTYWSDHCRHTTFLTTIDSVAFDEGRFNDPIKESYRKYLDSREFTYYKQIKEKDICLMDIATLAAKELRLRGVLDDLDISEEINACSIKVDVEIDGKTEPWLIMFKNETHNHPTEIEPFGGAATCLGGAIRDPLSGRAYVYQAMRLTGSGDPRAAVNTTLPGKLPQIKITREAAQGYSSYGNQIGLATGQVAEVYDPGFIAKRMEIGAVIGAAPLKNVRRARPEAGDKIILLGGRTGRDGLGGATGSSKEHDEKSLISCGAEVQKGNPPTERKIQRLFSDPDATTLVKKCNDFGAGGVSVAIGELADGLNINLDSVPKKYEGLDGTELAISESQERMAVVVEASDAERFIELAEKENLEATVVAEVTDNNRLRMYWRNNLIVDISREFLNTNGVRQKTAVKVASPTEEDNFFLSLPDYAKDDVNIHVAWLENLSQLHTASQKGLVEQFDSTIGAGTVLMPFGGKNQLTPTAGMAAKLPIRHGQSSLATLMSFGYNPRLAKWSPYHGALYAVVEAVSKIVAMGGSPHNVRLTLQEYFEKLGDDPYKWGKPFAALLGAFEAQKSLTAPAIGGKDSMSGSFKDLHVPPTLAAFAVNTVKDAANILSPEFKEPENHVINIPLTCDINEIPNFDDLKAGYTRIVQLARKGKLLSAQPVSEGGIAAAISKMCFGNGIGMAFSDYIPHDELFSPEIGSIIVEIPGEIDPEQFDELFDEVYYEYLGMTQEREEIWINGAIVPLDDCVKAWLAPLENVFPTRTKSKDLPAPVLDYRENKPRSTGISLAHPRVFIPVFPGTNCEFDTAKAFEAAGAKVETLVFKNLIPAHINESIEAMADMISKSQIIAIPGGFSAGDEPDGSGKFIAAVFKNPKIKEAVARHLEQNDGLMLGICNGFQALIKLGLVPYGEIREIDADSPTLTFNTIGRHVSCITRTKIVSSLSPWFSQCDFDEIYHIAVSHGEGRFVAPESEIKRLILAGQIATQYVDIDGKPSMDIKDNPNGSLCAIEGITSPDGRILGKMGHSERMWPQIAANIPGNKIQPIFKSGVAYYK